MRKANWNKNNNHLRSWALTMHWVFYRVFCMFYQASFSYHNVSKFYSCGNMNQYWIPLQTNITLYGHATAVPPSIRRIELLSPVVTLCLTCLETACFSKQPYHFTTPQECMRILISPCPCHHLLFSNFSHTSVYEMVSIYFSLMTYDIEYLYVFGHFYFFFE